MSIRPIAVLGSNRIPFARHNTFYANASNQDMMTAALDGLIERYKLQGQRMGEVAGGAVIKHSREFNLMRECVLGTSLDPATPACDLQQACAKFYGIAREDQDALALRSHQNLARAYDAGFFNDLISPYLGLNHDNNLRRDSTLEKLSKLKPAFDKVNGTLTAGNSTPFTDGA